MTIRRICMTTLDMHFLWCPQHYYATLLLTFLGYSGRHLAQFKCSNLNRYASFVISNSFTPACFV